MRTALLVIFAIVAPATASAAPARELTVNIAGVTRSFLLHVPQTAAVGKRPLVVLLHGGGGNGAQAMRAYGMNEVADAHGFLVAYPNGTGRLDGLLTWNAGNCCGWAMNHASDDVRFVRAVVDRVDRDFGLDRSRIYATGMSNGAMLAHRLGCEAADVFAAIAPVAGALNIPCAPSDAVAVAILHGTADEHVPYEGGTGRKALEPRVDQPVAHAVRTWVRANDCAKPGLPVRTGNVSRQTWTGCRDHAGVLLLTIHGGGHAWPGGVPPQRRNADVPTREISASEEIWKFFASHPKRSGS